MMQSPCACQRLPERPVGRFLCLGAPLGHTTGTIRNALRHLGLSFSEPNPNVLTVVLAPGDLDRIGPALTPALSSRELDDTRALLLDHEGAMTLQDTMRVEPLSRLLASTEGHWLTELLAERRLSSAFQPIVHTDTPDRVMAYECLLRAQGSDGASIPAGRLFDVAKRANLLFQLDSIARLTAIDAVVRHGVTTPVFINFSPASVYDPSYCLTAVITAIGRAGIAPERVVFEVTESEEVADVDHVLRILDRYREAGFRVALDDLGAGYSSLNLLTRLQPDFVKLDIGLVRDVHRDPYKATVADSLLQLARSLDIRTVAEGVETPGEWQWLREHQADFVQGYLFARPASPPPLPAIPDSVLALRSVRPVEAL